MENKQKTDKMNISRPPASAITLGEKLGYGAASVADSIAYTAVGTYLMFFITTVAGVDPGIAGVMSAIGAVWNAFMNIFMGFMSDRVRSRMGKRRPMMLLFAFPLALCLILLFTDISMPNSVKPLYYGLILMLYWTCYTGFFIPYTTLGSEYTGDYDARTGLRLFASFFNMLGNVVTMVLPTLLVGVLEGRGMSTSSAWSAVAVILAICSFASVIVTIASSKRKDPPCPAEEPAKSIFSGIKISAFFREYLSVASLKPVRWLIAASMLSLIGYSILLSDLMYFLTFNLGLTSSEIPLVLLARPVFSALMVPVTAKVAGRLDKRIALILFYAVGVAIMVSSRAIGVSGVPTLILYMLGNVACTCFYWQIVPSLGYDICEYDLLVSGKDRRGAIISFQGLVEAASSGIGALILGLILRSVGFDSTLDAQTEIAKTWIFNCATIVPIIFLVLAMIAIYKFPITRAKHAEIMAELAGRESDTAA